MSVVGHEPLYSRQTTSAWPRKETWSQPGNIDATGHDRMCELPALFGATSRCASAVAGFTRKSHSHWRRYSIPIDAPGVLQCSIGLLGRDDETSIYKMR